MTGMNKYIMRNKILDFWDDYKTHILCISLIAAVVITGSVVYAKNSSKEIYYEKGVVVDRKSYLKTNTKTHYVDDGYFVTTDTDVRYETQVKVISDGTIFVDSSQHAYESSIINETVKVKVVQHYWKGNKWFTTYYVD